MALPATHLRLARDLKSLLPVADAAAYYSGTLYPDSRMRTGIARELTHSDRCLHADFPDNDFTLGWFLHCWCDRLQERRFERCLPQLGEQEGHDRWITLSAAKMIQDRHDAADIDARLFSLLTHPANPHGESVDDLVSFYRMIQGIYRDPAAMTPDRYHALWLGAGVGGKTAGRLVAAMKQMMSDADAARRISTQFTALFQDISAVIDTFPTVFPPPGR